MDSSTLRGQVEAIVRGMVRPPVYEGRIAAPPNTDGRVWVVSRALAGHGRRIGPCPVDARSGSPQRGDKCWLSIDEGGQIVVVLWTPSESQVVAELPDPEASPDVLYQSDVENNGYPVVWRLRWVADEGRWAPVGATPLFEFVSTAETKGATVTTYGDLATAGPSLTVPLDGLYLVEHGHSGLNGTAGSGAYMSYAIGGAAASDANRTDFDANPSGSFVPVSTARRHELVAGALITAKYRGAGGTPMFQHRWLRITPLLLG